VASGKNRRKPGPKALIEREDHAEVLSGSTPQKLRDRCAFLSRSALDQLV
jgi:hypothetical protein